VTGNIGSVEVVLYAGLRGAEPREVGTLRMPLTLKSVSTGTVEGRLTDALGVVTETFQNIFNEEDS
jgi:hypothetical protein